MALGLQCFYMIYVTSNEAESETKTGLKRKLVRELEASLPAPFGVHAYCKKGSSIR